MKFIMGITGCNLCLETITNNNFKLLEGTLKDKLQVLIPVINWGNICREPKVCRKCSKIIKRTYGFKIFCLDNNKKLQQMKSAKKTSNRSLDSDSDTEDEGEDEVCCLCRQDDVFEDFEVANINLKEMVQKCFPQLNIYSSNNQGCCEECLNSLKDLDSFTNNCLESEKYVKNYCSTMGIKRRDRFNFDECIKRKNCPPTSTCNDGDLRSASQEIEAAASENMTNIETTQEPNRANFLQEESLQSDSIESEENVTELKEPSGSSTKQGKPVPKQKSQPSGKFRCGECDYTAKAKSALVSHMMKHKDPSKTKMHRCEVCGHETKRKGDLKWHMIVHKNPEDVKTYRCADCPYVTKRKADLKQHVVVHRTRLFRCDFCLFETKNEFYLNTFHMLLHKDKSEMNMFRCKLCPYETKRKPLMKEHSRVHVGKLKCNWCDFDTIYKSNLIKHLLTHKCHSEREIFKCHLCDYEGGFKKSLQTHMLVHNNPSQVIYECDECTYKTKRKQNLINHLRRHKDQSGLKAFECNVCMFKSKYKGSLRKHLLSHVVYLKTLPNKEDDIKTLMLQHSKLSKS